MVRGHTPPQDSIISNYYPAYGIVHKMVCELASSSKTSSANGFFRSSFITFSPGYIPHLGILWECGAGSDKVCLTQTIFMLWIACGWLFDVLPR